MIKNYLKVAIRNLWRHRAFAFINVLGLTVGMTAFYLIFSYVKFELSYDDFNSKADRIYRVVADIKTPTETIKASGPSWAVGAHIRREFPEIESVVRMTDFKPLVRRGDIKFQEDNCLIADSTLFRIFDLKLLQGDPATALRDKFSIVLSQTAAKKYFGTETNILGKTLLLMEQGYVGTITGVMRDIPENSVLKGDLILSMTTITDEFNKGMDDQWGNYGNQTYLLLKPGTNAKALQAKLPGFLERMDGTDMRNSRMFPTLYLEKLRDVYLRSTRGASKTGNINNLYIFSIVGIFILLIACFNFVNLTTARSTERAKEVGIRKVVGAARAQLARQFIGESLIISLLSFFLAVGLSAALLPLFNHLSGKLVNPGIFSHPASLLALFGTSLAIGVLAGIYPALVLSSFQPVMVLKGRFATGVKGTLLRKGLVVAQFTISIALIISTIVVYNQMHYMRSQDLGFDQNQKMILDTHGDSSKLAFEHSLASIPGVLSTSLAGSVPGGGNPGAYSQIENAHGDMQIANLDLYFVDFDYIPQYKMTMLAGRAFSRDFETTDTTQAMIVNEAAMKEFGYKNPRDMIGRKFDQWGRKGEIIGVVRDFHFKSLQQQIAPLSIRIEPSGVSLVTAEVSPVNLPATISAIEERWKTYLPNQPFSYFFLDEFFDRQYRSDDRFGSLFLNFAVLAIFISCLGLLGLSSYSTMQRTKEIGVRKVMGASVVSIIVLLSRSFVFLVLIAFVISGCSTWYFMHKWLEGFFYRTGISWWIFPAAGLLALFIALTTVGLQALKAARMNPVTSLRTE